MVLNMPFSADSLSAVSAAFLASAVEIVEALTIVLAVAAVRGARPAVAGTLAGLATLALLTVALGPALAATPIAGLRVVLGVLLLTFGLGWLRKAILRAGGVLAMHDEAEAFAEERAVLTRQRATDWIAGVAAFKAVLIEGIEVVFIVLAVGAKPGLLAPAAAGAALAALTVLAVGAVLRHPLTRVPENALKFTVGGLLTAFGVFWCGEGMGLVWPMGDAALPLLMILMFGSALFMAGRLRRGAAAP